MDKKLLERIASIAELELSEQEKEQMLKDFDSIFGFFSVIEEIKFLKKEKHFIEKTFRKEILEDCDSADLILNNFPEKKDRLLKL